MMRQRAREVRAWAKLVTAASRYRPTILTYHSIGRTASHVTLAPEAFRAQMAFLQAEGFEVVGLDECVARARAGATGRLAALTFDDGYADFSEAWGILRALGFPAHVFLITGRMGEAHVTSQGVPIPIMTWDRARALRDEGVSFGSHTETHDKLSGLDAGAVRRQLDRSREALVRELRIADPIWFCYPFGRNVPETRRLAREAGFVGAVTVEPGHPGPATDPFGVPRAHVHSQMSLREFTACFV